MLKVLGLVLPPKSFKHTHTHRLFWIEIKKKLENSRRLLVFCSFGILRVK